MITIRFNNFDGNNNVKLLGDRVAKKPISDSFRDIHSYRFALHWMYIILWNFHVLNLILSEGFEWQWKIINQNLKIKKISRQKLGKTVKCSKLASNFSKICHAQILSKSEQQNLLWEKNLETVEDFGNLKNDLKRC